MTMLSARVLNRTLLHRQHLLARTDATTPEMVRHLIGLQAQDNLPPYLSLAARLERFDPHTITRGLEDRSLVRLLTLRGTVHLLAADDALTLRPWTQARMDAEERRAQNVADARRVAREAFLAALAGVLAEGPLPQPRIGAALAERFPGYAATGLAQLARVRAPLAQLPPRGGWKQSGGVVYDYVDRWVGAALVEPTGGVVESIVLSYLAAFGPATAADVTAWSGVTRLGPLVTAMADRGDLDRHEDERGRPLFDVPGSELADPDVAAPVRLLGTYDNLWLSHAGRDRVTPPDKRRRWMGANGGAGCALFADGVLEGLWKVADGRVEVLETFRTLTARERTELDSEVVSVESLLATRAAS